MRTRLVLVFLFAILPLTGLIVYNYLEQYRTATLHAKDRVYSLTREMALTQDLWLENIQVSLGALAQTPAALLGDPLECRRILQGVAGANSLFYDLLVLHADGSLICSASGQPHPIGPQEVEFISTVLQQDGLLAGPFYPHPGEPRPLIEFAYPLKREPGRGAVMIASIDAAWINRAIARADLPEGSAVTIFDPGGTVLARYPDPERWVGQRFAQHPLMQAARQNGGGSLETRGIDLVPRLYGFSTISLGKEPVFLLGVGIPTDATYIRAKRLLYQNLGVLAALAIVILKLDWAGNRRFVLRPIDNLVKAARALASGDLNARSRGCCEGHELNILAGAFDALAEAIQTRELRLEESRRSLVESEARYRRLAENAQDIIYRYRYTEPRGFEYINPAVTQILGHTPEDICQDPGVIYRMVHPEDLDSLKDAFSNPEKLTTLRWVRKDGEIVWTEQRNAPIRDERGELIAVEGIGRDITRRMKTEAQVRIQAEANARLLEQAQRRARQLEEFYEISSSLRMARDPETLVQTLLRRSRLALAANTAGLLRSNEGALVYQAESQSAHPQGGQELPLPLPVIREYLASGEAVFASNRCEQAGATGAGPAAFILLPLQAGETVVGALFFGYDAPQNFSENRTWIARSIAGMAGNALHRTNINASLEQIVAERTRELNTLYSITSVASRSLDLKHALGEALEQVLRAVEGRVGGIFLYDPDEQAIKMLVQRGIPEAFAAAYATQPLAGSPEGRVILANEPVIIEDLRSEYPHLIPPEMSVRPSYIGTPMRVRGKAVGALSIARESDRPFNIEELSLLASIADHLGLNVETYRLHAQSQKMAVMEERSRLARELHDSITQMLYSAGMFANGARRFVCQGKTAQAAPYLEQLEALVGQSLREMRMLVYELRPSILEELGLAGAIEQRLEAVERRAGLEAAFRVDGPREALSRLPGAAEDGLFKIAIEALNNSIKHARARRVGVDLLADDDRIVLTVEDDGVGFDLEQAERCGGIGLASMSERAAAIGARLSLQSSPAAGTQVKVQVSLR